MKKEVKKTKKVTTDDLAIMIAKGFGGMDKRFDVVEKDIEGLKEEMKGVKNQLEGTNKRIDDMSINRVKYEDHNKLKSRVDVIEEKLEIK